MGLNIKKKSVFYVLQSMNMTALNGQFLGLCGAPKQRDPVFGGNAYIYSDIYITKSTFLTYTDSEMHREMHFYAILTYTDRRQKIM